MNNVIQRIRVKFRSDVVIISLLYFSKIGYTLLFIVFFLHLCTYRTIDEAKKSGQTLFIRILPVVQYLFIFNIIYSNSHSLTTRQLPWNSVSRVYITFSHVSSCIRTLDHCAVPYFCVRLLSTTRRCLKFEHPIPSPLLPALCLLSYVTLRSDRIESRKSCH